MKKICLEILIDCIEFIDALDIIDILIILCFPAHIHRIKFIFLFLTFFSISFSFHCMLLG